MTTITTRIQKSLTGKIISGELRPGHKLDEKTLATEFGVSRTPIREALRELGARGLIDLVPHRGGIVAQISLDQLSDMLDAECEIEALCARLGSQRMTAVEKGALQECHRQAQKLTRDRDETRYLEINQRFHDIICDGAHNTTLAAMARDLRARLAPFRQSQSEAARPKADAVARGAHADRRRNPCQRSERGARGHAPAHRAAFERSSRSAAGQQPERRLSTPDAGAVNVCKHSDKYAIALGVAPRRGAQLTGRRRGMGIGLERVTLLRRGMRFANVGPGEADITKGQHA